MTHLGLLLLVVAHPMLLMLAFALCCYYSPWVTIVHLVLPIAHLRHVLLFALSYYCSPWVDVVYCFLPYVVVVLLFVQVLTSPSFVLLLFASTLHYVYSPCVAIICWGVVFPHPLAMCKLELGTLRAQV